MLENAKLAKYQPAWALIKSHTDLEKAAARIGFPLVLKPAWGVKSQFVVKLDNLDEAKKALDYIKTNMTPAFDPIYKYGTDILAEEFMDGAEIDVDLLVQNGEVKFHAFNDNFPTKEPFFIETGDAMPSRHEDKDLADVLKMAKEVVKDPGPHQRRPAPRGKDHARRAQARRDQRAHGRRLSPRLDQDDLGSGRHRRGRAHRGRPALPSQAPQGPSLPPRRQVPDPGALRRRHRRQAPSEKADPLKVHEIAVQKEPGDAVLVPPEGFETIGWVVGRGDTYAEAEENLDEALRQVSINIVRFDSTSSLGKTRRKNRFGAAQVSRRRILQSARIGKVRGTGFDKKSLHVGILCNIFDAEGGEGAVHSDLTSVGLNIQKAVEVEGPQGHVL